MSLKLKDIADRLNISQATVSLALNNRQGVSQQTREKVLEVAAEMGYNMDSLSRVSGAKQKNIRFIIYKKHGNIVSDTPFFSALIEGIDEEARDNNYNVVISYIKEEENKFKLKELIRDNPLDGIIVLATEMNKRDLEFFDSVSVPMVMLDSFFSDNKFDTIVINNVLGSYQGTKYLINKGHEKIGYLQSSVDINNFHERKEGFLKALGHSNIKPMPEYVFELAPTLEGSYRDMIRILDSQPILPTAFYSDNDNIAFGAMKALKEKGIDIPKDVSIVGFDDMPFCDMVDPALTTIRVHKQSMGRLAVKRLIQRINGEDCGVTINIEVNTEIVERKSVIDKSK